METENVKLLSSRQVAERLGMGLGRFFGLRKRNEFPAPDAVLGNRPLWLEETVVNHEAEVRKATIESLRDDLQRLPDDQRDELVKQLTRRGPGRPRNAGAGREPVTA